MGFRPGIPIDRVPLEPHSARTRAKIGRQFARDRETRVGHWTFAILCDLSWLRPSWTLGVAGRPATSTLTTVNVVIVHWTCLENVLCAGEGVFSSPGRPARPWWFRGF